MIGETLKLDAVTLKRETIEMRFDTQIEAGKIAAIIGPSGAGKSTLLNLVAGFETPDAGSLAIGDADVTGKEPSERPVTMVFQENNLFSHLDVATNVSLGIRPHLSKDPSDRTLVKEALGRVGLADFENRMPGSLSGGERQRVAIARALVRRRPVLLLDEPFAALGPRLRRDMLLLVRQLQVETGMTVLIVTHQPQEAAAIADTIVFLDKGRTIATGSADGFFERSDVKGLADYLGEGGQ
ncbi:thiamine ABC transporter ATP-binding protein [Hoeflea sp.]|uniref:thiamine ABC transporter ATP-binding protein n=1 Tax=Hoeflea sp. TaxID=1940281 RepID=UPI003B02E011